MSKNIRKSNFEVKIVMDIIFYTNVRESRTRDLTRVFIHRVEKNMFGKHINPIYIFDPSLYCVFATEIVRLGINLKNSKLAEHYKHFELQNNEYRTLRFMFQN